MRKEAAADGMGGDNVDSLVVSVFVACAFVKDLSKFGSVGRLWLGGTFSVASPVVFGGNSSSLLDIGFVTVLFGWQNFESAISNEGDFGDFNEAMPLLCDVTTETPKLAF